MTTITQTMTLTKSTKNTHVYMGKPEDAMTTVYIKKAPVEGDNKKAPKSIKVTVEVQDDE